MQVASTDLAGHFISGKEPFFCSLQRAKLLIFPFQKKMVHFTTDKTRVFFQSQNSRVSRISSPFCIAEDFILGFFWLVTSTRAVQRTLSFFFLIFFSFLTQWPTYYTRSSIFRDATIHFRGHVNKC